MDSLFSRFVTYRRLVACMDKVILVGQPILLPFDFLFGVLIMKQVHDDGLDKAVTPTAITGNNAAMAGAG